MYRIISKKTLAPKINEYVIEAKSVALHAHPGQFIILRVDEEGERIPFTICDFDKNKGTVTVLVQEVGYSTAKLAAVPEGGYISDFVGPLGQPTDLTQYRRIALVGGGIGSAVIFPQAKKLHAENKRVDVVLGARTGELVMYEQEFRQNCDNLLVATNDGSKGIKGLVTDALESGLKQGKYDCVMAVGPLLMMKAVCEQTKKYGVKTVVSMNPLMVDGTGMCGCCRVSVGGTVKYACVDGPEFDGHEVDWDNAVLRLKAYGKQEKAHYCRMTGEIRR
ncbi:MAG: sulfide/dihydroorotate dehydrogenase-like FAD/NAD-binding protein [Candidatus Neoclostridium sp.]